MRFAIVGSGAVGGYWQQDKPIEVEALIGTVVRRGARAGVPTPIMAAWYAVLKPHAYGRVPRTAKMGSSE
jgi:ketopantoate reductase